MTGQRWLVQCWQTGKLPVVDDRLQRVWLQVPAGAGRRDTQAVAGDLSLAALWLQ